MACCEPWLIDYYVFLGWPLPNTEGEVACLEGTADRYSINYAIFLMQVAFILMLI